MQIWDWGASRVVANYSEAFVLGDLQTAVLVE